MQTTGTDPTLGDCTELSYGCPVTSRSDTTMYYGPGLPTNNFSLINTVRAGAFTFYALVSMERGAFFGNSDRPYRIRQGGADEWLKALGPNGEATFKSDSIRQYASILNYVDKRDNVRLRELSVVVERAGEPVGQVGAGATSITLSGQNVWWWDDCNCVDPNMNWAGAGAFGFNNGFLDAAGSARVPHADPHALLGHPPLILSRPIMSIQRTISTAGRAAACAGAIALFLFGVACGSALDVPNPQAFGDDALNNTIILKNVTNGAEGCAAAGVRRLHRRHRAVERRDRIDVDVDRLGGHLRRPSAPRLAESVLIQ